MALEAERGLERHSPLLAFVSVDLDSHLSTQILLGFKSITEWGPEASWAKLTSN